MSDELFMACDWRIRPGVNYLRLAALAQECDCELVMVEAHAVTAEKFVMLRLAVQSATQNNFDDFQEAVAEIGLSDWRPCTGTYFAQGQALDFRGVDAAFLQQWMAAMNAYGLHNEALRQEIEGS
jgi:hypothetical protein